MKKRIVEELKQNIVLYAVNVMLALLVWSLLGQLKQSRSNENEMSRRLYQAVRGGTQR